MNVARSSRFITLAAAATLGLALSGCTAYDQPRSQSSSNTAAPVSQVSTPAMQPDRYTNRPRSFSDPGPMYPDTGR